ncbi:glycogen debranching enzyme, partial [Actinoplanes xinjiangensis]
DFWRGEPSSLGEFASRFTGSSDLYQDDGRRPLASINFVTAHDGFTLHDLVSYNEKHNDANGEGNRDGESHNRSWNCGVEGETEDADVIVLRERQKRNFLATLLLSQGVPMIAHGDELGRTQHGNNNVYCQDNEISWMDWDDARNHDVQTSFIASLTALRADHPIFRRRRFFTGQAVNGSPLPDIAWLRRDGDPMTEPDWTADEPGAVTVFLNGHGIPESGALGEPITDDSFLLLFNAAPEPADFTLPDQTYGQMWETVVDTADPLPTDDRGSLKAQQQLTVPAHTLLALRCRY